jgi:hypothetical protein
MSPNINQYLGWRRQGTSGDQIVFVVNSVSFGQYDGRDLCQRNKPIVQPLIVSRLKNKSVDAPGPTCSQVLVLYPQHGQLVIVFL